LFFEYVRPQQVYPAIDIIPFAWTAIVLSVCCLFMEGQKLRKWYAADKMLAVFSVWILVCSVLATYPEESYKSLSLYFGWILIYFLITNIASTEERFMIFLLGFLIYSTKMSQHGFRSFVERGGGLASWGASGAPGWFQNSGEFGIQMCIFFPLAVYFTQALRPYWTRRRFLVFLFMPASAAISIVASSSRGAVLGLIPVLMWMMAKSRKRVLAFVLTAVIGTAVVVLLPAEQKQRFQTMGNDQSSMSRLAYWKRGMDMMNNHPLMGVGYKNWMKYSYLNYEPYIDPNNGQPMYQLPHNIFIEAGAELGYTGLAMFVGLIFMTWYTNSRTRKKAREFGKAGTFSILISHGLDAALIGYLVGGFFVTVLYYPFFWINLAMTVALHQSVMRRAQVSTQPAVRPVRAAEFRRGIA